MASTGKPGRRRVAEATVPYGDLGHEERVRRVVAVIGATSVADLLGVSRAQPGRWASGKDRISAENLRNVIDLDYVLSRLLVNWEPVVAVEWLRGHNPFINGRPIDSLRLHGVAGVLRALDADDQGAYA